MVVGARRPGAPDGYALAQTPSQPSRAVGMGGAGARQRAGPAAPSPSSRLQSRRPIQRADRREASCHTVRHSACGGHARPGPRGALLFAMPCPCGRATDRAAPAPARGRGGRQQQRLRRVPVHPRCVQRAEAPRRAAAAPRVTRCAAEGSGMRLCGGGGGGGGAASVRCGVAALRCAQRARRAPRAVEPRHAPLCMRSLGGRV